MNGDGETLILDTNAVIQILNDEGKSVWLDEQFPRNSRGISVISQIELLGFPGITEETEDIIRSFLDDVPIIAIELDIVETAIQVRRIRPGIKLPDAVIMATSIFFKAWLITNDEDLLHFSFPGFRVQKLP